jgi:hypothetical protein
MKPSPAPLLVESFQRHQEHSLKHPGSVYFITTKQNKPPSFIDQCEMNYIELKAMVIWNELH